METSKAKQVLRKDMACRKKEYSTTWLSARSREALARLEALTLFGEAKTVALYHALPDEVQTAGFIEKWHKKKTLLLPIVEGDNLILHPYQGKDNLRQGAYRILEPLCERAWTDKQIDLIIIPGVAFDRQGNRLGRGKGYYDRLLASTHAPKIGLCFSFQLLDKIPTEPFDIRMDGIVTDQDTYIY